MATLDNRPMARPRARRRDASTSRRTFGSLAQRNAVRRGTSFFLAHTVIDWPRAIAWTRLVFLLMRTSSGMAHLPFPRSGNSSASKWVSVAILGLG
jgi:hypothetical protein